MAYSKTNWVDGRTALNASNMNHIENGILVNSEAIDQLNTRVQINEELSKQNISSAINSSYFNTLSSNAFCYKRSGVVVVSGKLIANSSIGFAETVNVLTLSSDYKPPMGLHVLAHVRRGTSASFCVFVYITEAGLIRVEYPSSEIASGDSIYFTATYPTL